MIASSSAIETGWQAALSLRYARRADKTVLTDRTHSGPLRVQKALYPEGAAVCHSIIIHPPGGIAGGDQLTINAALEQHAGALLTTPGASKWYRSSGATARQYLRFSVAENARLEWLPQENILYNQSQVELSSQIVLENNAGYVGWEIFCFGRTASGECYRQGAFRQKTEIFQNGKRLWNEFANIAGESALLLSPTTMAGFVVTGTMLVAGLEVDADTLAACRALEKTLPQPLLCGISRLPQVLAARYLGNSSEQAKDYFVALWQVLRPRLLQRTAMPPRIWRT